MIESRPAGVVGAIRVVVGGRGGGKGDREGVWAKGLGGVQYGQPKWAFLV